MRVKINHRIPAVLIVALAATFGACSSSPTKSPDVAGDVRHALDNAGLKDVSVSQDRDKGVVTLGGHVTIDADKTRAESVATSLVAGQVLADQIAVIPVGEESAAKTVNKDLDAGIEKNMDAALITANLRKDVKFKVKNNVVTLTGNVATESARTQAGYVAAGVPNVSQVVNELQIRNQKATVN